MVRSAARYKELSDERLRRLNALGLDPANSIVVGSGIMAALGIRPAQDLDLVVSESAYQRLRRRPELVSTQVYGQAILTGDDLEIGRLWPVLGDECDLATLSQRSVVLDGVRYVSLDFLRDVKEHWGRDKDRRDVGLIRDYQKNQEA